LITRKKQLVEAEKRDKPMASKLLLFSALHERHIGVTEGVAKNYFEAARVCLDRHHSSPIEFALTDNTNQDHAQAEWISTDNRTKNAWANKDDATRDAAYGMSLAAVELMRGLVAVGRAETRTGADYYLGEPGTPSDDLEATYRLEVSGTDEGNDTAIFARLRQKLDQARKGTSNLPAIASVVGFAALRIVSADLEAGQP
jgi:hypothetical protein